MPRRRLLSSRAARLAWLLGILALAFGIRVFRLGHQDLSDDEAFFVQITHLGTYWSLAGSTEPHPPLYLALLQGWMLISGVTEYAVRFPSILFGLGTVAGMYQLGRTLAGSRLGLAAAFVAALNPYQIAYSQTARDYEIACCFALLSFVMFLRAVKRPQLLPGYAVAALLAVFSHYYAIAIVLLEQAWLVAWFARGKLPEWRRWLAADAAIAIVYLPWSLYALRTVAGYEPGHGTPTILGQGLRDAWDFYTLGLNFHPANVLWPSVAMVAVLALGVVGLRMTGGLGVALAYQGAVLLFGLATLVHTKQFGARFVFIGSPGYLLVVAGALVLVWQRARLAVPLPGALLVGLAGFAVHNAVLTDEYITKGYSQLAAYLQRHIAPRDTVVLDAVSQTIQYWYYADLRDGIGERVEIMPKDASGNGADGTPVDVGKTEAALRQIAASSSGMWLLDDDSLRYDPHLDTQRLLAANWPRVSSQVFVNQRLDFYSVAGVGSLTPVNVVFEGATLVAVSRVPSPVPPGQPLALHALWHARRPFKESLRLTDAGGTVVSQQDLSPAGGFAPSAGDVDDHPGLMVPAGLRGGVYRLQLVAYDPSTGAGLGPVATLQDVTVAG